MRVPTLLPVILFPLRVNTSFHRVPFYNTLAPVEHLGWGLVAQALMGLSPL